MGNPLVPTPNLAGTNITAQRELQELRIDLQSLKESVDSLRNAMTSLTARVKALE